MPSVISERWSEHFGLFGADLFWFIKCRAMEQAMSVCSRGASQLNGGQQRVCVICASC